MAAWPCPAKLRRTTKALCLQAGCHAAMGMSEALSNQGKALTHLAVGVQPAVHLPAKGCEGRIKVVLDCY